MDKSLDWTKPLRTKDGREVRIYAHDAGGSYPVHGAYRSKEGNWIPCGWAANGAYSVDYVSDARDLFNAPAMVKVDCWFNVRADGTLGAPFPFRADLDRSASAIDRVAVKHITFEIEEGTIDE